MTNVNASHRASPAPVNSMCGENLTARESEILLLVARGLSDKEIARALGISTATVKTHLHRVYVKLNASGRYKAVLSHAAGARG